MFCDSNTQSMQSGVLSRLVVSCFTCSTRRGSGAGFRQPVFMDYLAWRPHPLALWCLLAPETNLVFTKLQSMAQQTPFTRFSLQLPAKLPRICLPY